MAQPICAMCGVTHSVPGRPRKHPSGWEQTICISKRADTDRRLIRMIRIIQWTSVKFIYTNIKVFRYNSHFCFTVVAG